MSYEGEDWVGYFQDVYWDSHEKNESPITVSNRIWKKLRRDYMLPNVHDVSFSQMIRRVLLGIFINPPNGVDDDPPNTDWVRRTSKMILSKVNNMMNYTSRNACSKCKRNKADLFVFYDGMNCCVKCIDDSCA